MRRCLLASIGLALALVVGAASPLQLDTDSFHSLVAGAPSTERWFLFFFSPHCGHCAAMEPAWAELAEMEPSWAGSTPGVGGKVRLATIDATAETGLAETLDVNGYPTLLAFDGPSRAVFEYDGDRSAGSLHAFATHANPADAGGRRRGFLTADGTIRPSLIDLIWRVPADASEIVSFAIGTSRISAALLAAALVGAGVLLAMAASGGAPPAAQFIVVECPAGVKPGEAFPVQFTTTAAGRIFGRSQRLVTMNVSAPAGIAAGQSFFVPLVKPPEVRPCPEDHEKKA